MKNVLFAITAFVLLAVGKSYAGTACNNTSHDPGIFVQASQSAAALHRDLNRLHPKVALIARVGSDLNKYGMHYSHIAFVVKDYSQYKNRWSE